MQRNLKDKSAQTMVLAAARIELADQPFYLIQSQYTVV